MILSPDVSLVVGLYDSLSFTRYVIFVVKLYDCFTSYVIGRRFV